MGDVYLYLHREAARHPMPDERPFQWTVSGEPIGALLLGETMAGYGSESVSRLFPQQILPISTSDSEGIHYDFAGEAGIEDSSSCMRIFPLEANTITSASYGWRPEVYYTISEPGQTHTVWLKTWVTPPLSNSVTFSAATTFGYYGAHAYCSSKTTSARLRMVVYAWDTATDAQTGDFLYDGTSTVSLPWFDARTTNISSMMDTLSKTGYWLSEPFQSTVTLSVGNKLCFELSEVDDSDIDIATHVIAYDGNTPKATPNSLPFFIVNHSTTPVFRKYVNRTKGFAYNVINTVSHTTSLTYSVEGVLEKTLGTMYDIGSTSSFCLNTSSPLRGHASLFIRPNTTFPDTDPNFTDVSLRRQYYNTKFPNKQASLNKYKMIDDFEQYETDGDLWALGGWQFTYHDTDSSPYMEAKKFFAVSDDFSGYNVISVLGKASRPNSIEVYFVDVSERTSSMNTILINTLSGRYECAADMYGCYQEQIASIVLRVRNCGTISIDDIVLLKQREEDRYYEWMPIQLENVSTDKQSKISAIKVPYRVGETIQYHGEYSAKGTMVLRTFDNRETTFLSEAERDRTALYLRANLMGMPIEVESHETTFVDYSNQRLKTNIQVNFLEIYDSAV